MQGTRSRSVVLAALILVGACLSGCRRDRPTPAAQGSGAASGSTDGAEQETLALMPPGGPGPIDGRVSRLQAEVRRAPSARAFVALGRAWIQKARNAADPGFYLNADACAALALARDPEASGAHALRAAVHLDAHRFEAARAAAEDALRRAPDDLFALGVLADALLELGRYDEATVATDRMMSLKPSLPAYARASYLLWLRGHLAPALEAARRAIDAAGGADPEPRAWMTVQTATMFWHRGDLDGAEAGFDRALAALPGYPPALVGKGRVALARGDARGAVRLLDEAWRRSPHAEVAWLLGDARAAAGDPAGARAAYSNVEPLGRAGEGRVLALFLATRGQRVEEALHLAEAERQVRPDLYSDDVYAWALYRAGRLDEARTASDRALRLGTPDPRLLYHAGAIRIAAGERRAGRALIQRALALNPGFDWFAATEAGRLIARPSATARAGRR